MKFDTLQLRAWVMQKGGYDYMSYNIPLLELNSYAPQKDNHITEVIFMECTGITDAGGKKIYEMDILNGNFIVCFDKKEAKWKVVAYEEYYLHENDDTFKGEELHTINMHVSGNIFENNEQFIFKKLMSDILNKSLQEEK